MNAGQWTPGRACLLAGVAGIAFAVCGGHSAAAQAEVDEVLVENLLKKIKERDAAILDLAKRVQQLEQRADAARSAPAGATAAPAAGATGAGGVAPSRSTAQAGAPAEAPTSPQTPVASEDAAADTAQPTAPGTFAVEPEDAERALERTLVQAGVLLLPFGAIDVEPGFTYVRRGTTTGVGFVESGVVQVRGLDIDENYLAGSLDFRFGLPWTSQFEVGVPFVYKDQSEAFQNTEASTSAFGLGDVSVGLAKELLRERGWRPDLIARVTWNADTGQEKDRLELGSGFHSITGSLTALKRQDPLAFFATGFYRTSFEKDDKEPGDEFGFSLGTVLAASPDTSLFFSLEQIFANEDKSGDTSFAGSDEVNSVLVVGASSVLGRGVLLSVNAGIGLTDDAPDYFVRVSLPIRFNLPIQ